MVQGVVLRQDFHAVELSLAGYTVDFVQALGDFSLDGVEVRPGSWWLFSRLNRQFNAHAAGCLLISFSAPFSGLRNGDTVVSVTGSLSQTFDVRGETVSNRLTCRIVFRAVDTQTRRQTLDSGAPVRTGICSGYSGSAATDCLVLITCAIKFSFWKVFDNQCYARLTCVIQVIDT
ncbi:Uncharacterised protein [Salmonella sp. NCTC 11881]|nr:Uncharacterised protein [Salmonella sp. NCTC 11881]